MGEMGGSATMLSTPPVLAAAGSIPVWLLGPFALLLQLIAVMPLTPPGVKHVWEKYYAHISAALGLFVAAWFFLKIPAGAETVLHTGLEYISFIALIGSLFVVAGGIHLRVKGAATLTENLAFLALGALAANFVGTTGASMVLIRPWIRMNRSRIGAYHVVFFIFIVSNCGGALTPIGDPPLFLGYLRGVPFFWLVGNVAAQWALVVGALLAVFYAFDRRGFARVSPAERARAEGPDNFRVEGKRNLGLLAVVIGAVFIPGTVPLLREAVMVGAAVISYAFTPKRVHEANAFGFGPIKEVGFLFVGIFLTMMPALAYIAEHGAEFGVKQPMQFYVAAGSLSAVLDNAPTYATFFELARSAAQAGAGAPVGTAELLRGSPALVIAVSLGAVFFGAMTYIGNGPNFMVKAIADAEGVKTPGFFGYVFRFSLPFLLPILLLSGWLCL
jgi:Na+/H+ antiporter NhaD/arsenite permease-like protein